MQTVLEGEEKRTERAGGQSSARKDLRAPGKMTLFVKSQRVCMVNQVLNLPAFSGTLGPMITTRSERVVVYENVLDDAQNEALKDARALADCLGFELVVKDISQHGVLARFLGFILRNDLNQRVPALSLEGKAIESLASIS